MGNFSPPGGFQLPGSTSWKRGLVTVDVRCFLSKKKHPKWEIWMEKKTKPPRSFFVFGGVATCSYVATDQLRPMAAPVRFSILCTLPVVCWVGGHHRWCISRGAGGFSDYGLGSQQCTKGVGGTQLT